MRTDASTTGFGGILLSQEGVPLRYWHAELPPDVLATLGLPAGEPGHMTAYELLALFFSLVIWRRWLGNKAVAATAQLDNSSALKITAKLTSKEAICNRIAAEIALQVAWAQIHTFEHYRNTLNVEADALSRVGEGKDVPKRLRRVPRDSFPVEPLQSIAMKDWPRTEGLKKEKKERRKRQKEAGGQALGLWLWLDKPWLWALFEALALTYGLWVCGARGCRRGGRGEPPAKDEPLEPSEQPLPPPLGSEGGGRRSPRRRVRRTQTACKEKPPVERLQPAPLGRKTRASQWTCPLRLRSRVPARPRPRVRAFGRPLPSPLGGRPPASP